MGHAAVLRGDDAGLGVERLGDEGGLGVAGAERAEGGEGSHRALGELAGVHHHVHPAAGLEVLLAEPPRGDGLEGAPEVEEALGLERDAGGVAVAAELREMLGALAERLDEVEALDAAGAALPHPALDADDQGGLVEALDDARGDDADDAGVPALRPRGRGRARPARVLGLGDGLDEHLLLDLLALLRWRRRACRRGARLGRGLRVRRSCRPTEASSSRPAALMRGPRRKPTWPALTEPSVSSPATSLSARTPGRSALRQRLEAVPDEDAVGAGERDDVAHGGERDEVHQRLERGLGPALEPPEGAERAPERHHQVEGDARRRRAPWSGTRSRAGAG